MGKNRILILLILSLGFAWLIAMGTPMRNEDLFLAFCSGRQTLAHGPAWLDPWSFTIGGTLWVDQSWLSHLIYYLSYLTLGDLGPVLLKAVLLAACFLILYFQSRRFGAGSQISAIALILGCLSLAPFMGIRAQNFGMFYFVCFVVFLTAPVSWGRIRQIGALLVLAAWSNSHGSFMLGFFVIATRVLVDLLCSLGIICSLERWANSGAMESSKENDSSQALEHGALESEKREASAATSSDVWAWGITLLIAIGVMAWVNPYGSENLRIPFRQLLATSVTPRWVDWFPLIHPPTLFSHGFFGPGSVLPFLALGILMTLLLLTMTLMDGTRGTVSTFVQRPKSADRLMQVAILVLMAPLVYKFQRMIIFVVPVMIPILAVLIQRNTELIGKRFPKSISQNAARPSLPLYAAAFGLFILMITLFHRLVVVPALPWNPMYPSSQGNSVASQWMSAHLDWVNAAEFMQRNNINGRIFTNEYLSGYLLFNVPNIKVLFDLRAQSLYPDNIIETYFSLLGTVPEKLDSTLSILDRSQVAYVVLNARQSRSFSIATLLMETKKWACIYYDRAVLVLARTDSEHFRQIISSATLDGLWYPNPETKIVTQAVLSRFMTGTINSELMSDLIATLHEHPDPNLYALVIAVMNGSSDCLNPETQGFLDSEANRLAASEYVIPDGFRSILKSLLDILQVLENNQISCGSDYSPNKYRPMKNQVITIARDLSKQYK